MFNLDKFISDSVTFRPVSMFAADIDAVCNDLDELQQTSLNFDNMQTVKKNEGNRSGVQEQKLHL